MTLKIVVAGPVGRKRTCVMFDVTWADVRDPKQIFTRKPGRFAFRGAWYGRDLRQQKTYGKVEGQSGRVIGTLSSQPTSYLWRKLK